MAFDFKKDVFGAGITRGQKANRAFKLGMGLSVFGVAQDFAMIGFQASKAGKGGFVPSLVGQGAASVIGVPLAGFASAALCLIPGVGPLAASIAGSVIAGYGEYRIGSSLIKTVRFFTDMNKRTRHLEMGGNYRDTEMASRLRMNAIQDMSASLIPSRRYLGQEALLMHR